MRSRNREKKNRPRRKCNEEVTEWLNKKGLTQQKNKAKDRIIIVKNVLKHYRRHIFYFISQFFNLSL